jgi:hypothetical protein
MNANQQPEEDLTLVAPERQPWTEAWEKAWEAAYQKCQQEEGWDKEVASLRNRAVQENDARYLGQEYYATVSEYIPKAPQRNDSAL